MVRNTMQVKRTCSEGHIWKQEMTVQEVRELLKSKNYSHNCPHCRYGDGNIMATNLLEQYLNNEIR